MEQASAQWSAFFTFFFTASVLRADIVSSIISSLIGVGSTPQFSILWPEVQPFFAENFIDSREHILLFDLALFLKFHLWHFFVHISLQLSASSIPLHTMAPFSATTVFLYWHAVGPSVVVVVVFELVHGQILEWSPCANPSSTLQPGHEDITEQ